jgi:hypothetical protein
MRIRIKNEGPAQYRAKCTLIDRPSVASEGQTVHSETFDLVMGEEKEVYVHSLRDLLVEETTERQE